MTATQKVARDIVNVVDRVRDGANDTRVPSGTLITIQRGKKSIPVVVTFDRGMNKR